MPALSRLTHTPRPALRAAAFLFVALIALAAPAQQLESRRTKDLDLIYYDKAHEYLSYHLARAFTNSLAFDKKLFHYQPSEPIVILMQDFADTTLRDRNLGESGKPPNSTGGQIG